MDLESTLIRAEALFKKFNRLVLAIDKKENFPEPRRQSPIAASPPAASSGSSASPPGAAAAQNTGKGPESQKKVITPELRQLLSRKVEILPREEVADNGDGFVPGAGDQ